MTAEKRAQERAARERRLEIANQVIRVIGSHGRRFLSSNSDKQNPSPDPDFARFELRHCEHHWQLWYRDRYTQKWIYTAFRGRWRGFSDGGTLRRLIEALHDYIAKGDMEITRYFGPFPDWSCGGDPWGYGDEMEITRNEALALLQPPQEQQAA